MSNETETIIFLRRHREAASEKEEEDRTWSARTKALVGRLKGSLKATEAEEQVSLAGRSIEQMIALYAPDEQPDFENRKLPTLWSSGPLRPAGVPLAEP